MDPLAHYTLPIGGLEIGVHQFSFDVDAYFLEHCPDSPHHDADIKAEVIVDKRVSMLVMDIFLTGTVACNCDRCTADINLPVNSEYQVILKVKEEVDSRAEDEIIYIEPGQTQFKVDKLLYDVLLVSVPLKKIYDCESDSPRPCDMDVLNRLEQDSTDDNESTESSIWDEIKKNIEFK